MHGVPHGGMLELNQILEDGIAEHAARVLRLAVGQGGARLIEVHGHQRGLARLAAVRSHLHFVGMLEEMHHHVVLVVARGPIWKTTGPKEGK